MCQNWMFQGAIFPSSESPYDSFQSGIMGVNGAWKLSVSIIKRFLDPWDIVGALCQIIVWVLRIFYCQIICLVSLQECTIFFGIKYAAFPAKQDSWLKRKINWWALNERFISKLLSKDSHQRSNSNKTEQAFWKIGDIRIRAWYQMPVKA